MIARPARSTSLATLALAVTATAAFAGTAAAAGPADGDSARQLINLDSDTVVVYEDGRVYQRTDVGDWYQPRGMSGSVRMAPPPPPGAFEWAVLSPEAVDELLDRVDDLGLAVDDVDFGDPAISDSPTSTLDVIVDGEQVSHSVYAPDFSEGLTPEQQQHRADYDALRAVLFDLEGEFGSELTAFEPYVPDQWVIGGRRIVSGDVDRPWPLDEPPVDGDCVALPSDTDRDTATGGYRYDGDVVIVDAALPGDPRCAPPATTTR